MGVDFLKCFNIYFDPDQAILNRRADLDPKYLTL